MGMRTYGVVSAVLILIMVAYPDILLQVSEKLEAQQQSAANRTVQTALTTQPELQATLLHVPATPVVPSDGGVTVVQFFDYQCIWCARMAPVVADFVRDNPDVRFVFKEFPIFGSRWPMSVQAARTGLTLWHLKYGAVDVKALRAAVEQAKAGGH